MIKFQTIAVMLFAFTLGTLGFSNSAAAQKYRTTADTVKLNKEYGEVKLDIAELNSKLIEQQNKTAGYQSKITSTAKDAATSAQNSKETATTATNGDMADAKTAMKQAKKASNQADDAGDAIDDKDDNAKDIKKLLEKINKKTEKLTELEQQKAAIMLKLNSSAAM
ncbi:hypothetical protein [Mucilaginibacter auburnensis]|uniref:Uncharacterized protein n=1 Tax=Mucilaginibacter auburnensis TaxID=1457233 RepID=A0A2H9VW17_9SPHI|nr:hypothetical protein [Mucilaginibacter auburnensis]PJJ85010.1 hypothetical protein CLV57_2033 [Mucilaginibacter auburnensis]